MNKTTVNLAGVSSNRNLKRNASRKKNEDSTLSIGLTNTQSPQIHISQLQSYRVNNYYIKKHPESLARQSTTNLNQDLMYLKLHQMMQPKQFTLTGNSIPKNNKLENVEAYNRMGYALDLSRQQMSEKLPYKANTIPATLMTSSSHQDIENMRRQLTIDKEKWKHLKGSMPYS